MLHSKKKKAHHPSLHLPLFLSGGWGPQTAENVLHARGGYAVDAKEHRRVELRGVRSREGIGGGGGGDGGGRGPLQRHHLTHDGDELVRRAAEVGGGVGCSASRADPRGLVWVDSESHSGLSENKCRRGEVWVEFMGGGPVEKRHTSILRNIWGLKGRRVQRGGGRGGGRAHLLSSSSSITWWWHVYRSSASPPEGVR